MSFDDRLHLATKEGDLEKMKALIDEGVDVNGRNDLSQTPMHVAARYDKLDAAKLLHENNGDVAAQDKFGEAPQWIAEKWGHAAML